MKNACLLLTALMLASCTPPDTPPVARGVAHQGLDGRYAFTDDRWRENVQALFAEKTTSAAIAEEFQRQGFTVVRVGETTMSANYCWPSGEGSVAVIWIEQPDGTAQLRVTSYGNSCVPALEARSPDG